MKRIIFLVIVIGVVCAVIALQFTDNAGFDVIIQNETEVDVEGLYLTYNNIHSDIQIPTVRQGDKITINVNPTEEFGENSMSLYYKDHNGKIHQETVFGYFEKGYFGHAVVTFEDIDEDGLIKMKMVEKMFE
ncbi:hypothetical protein AABM38_10570 [Heyndrickxia sp. MSNUG]|uniref:hypothetical protein n=1 Tax=Heyndrickxia sp. MSNUG TaxID=3136677 RepID=UPI003C2DA3C2